MYLYSKLFAKSLFGEEVGNNRHKINTKGHTHAHTHACTCTHTNRERERRFPSRTDIQHGQLYLRTS